MASVLLFFFFLTLLWFECDMSPETHVFELLVPVWCCCFLGWGEPLGGFVGPSGSLKAFSLYLVLGQEVERRLLFKIMCILCMGICT